MVTITRKFDFCYAHFLEGHQGKCCNMHGHNALLEIEIAQRLPGIQTAYYNKQKKKDHTVPLQEAMVMDFGDLSKAVKEHILDPLDHKVLNEIFPFHPTAENIAIWIANTLQDHIDQLVVRVRVWETVNCYAEWKRRNSG